MQVTINGESRLLDGSLTVEGLLADLGIEHARGVVDASAARVAFLERTLPPDAAARVTQATKPARRAVEPSYEIQYPRRGTRGTTFG